MLYGVPQYVADMVTLIARLNVQQVKWVGTSMGGLIGMTLASLKNSPIERLVLNDVGAVLSGEALARIAGYLGLVTQFPDRATAHKILRDIFSGFGTHSDQEWHDLIDPGLLPDAQGDGVRVHYDPAIAEPFRQAYQVGVAAPNLELWPVYDAIQCPTLLMRGAQSDLCTQAVANEMAGRGPRAKIVAFEGVGHAPSLMHDDQIQVVSEFLSEGH
jgi:pimeloyl-ACP methyl ester carboxylesterase